jgi:AraC-like DNA-binding protein
VFYVCYSKNATEVFGEEIETTFTPLYECENDTLIVASIERFLLPFVSPRSKKQAIVQNLVSLVKNNEAIFTVAQLSNHANLSSRTIQRYFAQYLGISPKWLIRKYRLRRVLDELENSKTTILDAVVLLAYADQSHLIRDFKEMLGITPSEYRSLSPINNIIE